MLLLLVACGGKEAKMAKGFALPKGDIEKGKQAFIDMKCHQCHTVSGEKLPEFPPPLNYSYVLAAKFVRSKLTVSS